MTVTVHRLINNAKQAANAIIARPGSFAWTDQQKIGEFVTQLRRMRDQTSLSQTDHALVEKMLNPTQWKGVGILYQDIAAPDPDLIAIEQGVGRLEYLLKQMTELRGRHDNVMESIVKMKGE